MKTYFTYLISGYGNIAPVTTEGRVFCILFAIVGIPFTLSVISDIGQIFATLLSSLWNRHKDVVVPGKISYIILFSVDEKGLVKIFLAIERSLGALRCYRESGEGGEMKRSPDEEDEDGEGGLGGNTLTAVLALVFLTCFLSIGSFIFTIWEGWSFFDAFYFCFITMTTIGFGDIVPGMTLTSIKCYLILI